MQFPLQLHPLHPKPVQAVQARRGAVSMHDQRHVRALTASERLASTRFQVGAGVGWWVGWWVGLQVTARERMVAGQGSMLLQYVCIRLGAGHAVPHCSAAFLTARSDV